MDLYKSQVSVRSEFEQKQNKLISGCMTINNHLIHVRLGKYRNYNNIFNPMVFWSLFKTIITSVLIGIFLWYVVTITKSSDHRWGDNLSINFCYSLLQLIVSRHFFIRVRNLTILFETVNFHTKQIEHQEITGRLLYILISRTKIVIMVTIHKFNWNLGIVWQYSKVT